MKSTQITAFLEGMPTNEAYYHELEHRIFELEPWKTIEGDQEYEIEAFAYSTGILFRIRSFSCDTSTIPQSFYDVLGKGIPELSIPEKKRFMQELKERNDRMSKDFDERAGEEFLKQFESIPIFPDGKNFCEAFSRIGIIFSDEAGTRYEEKRVADIPPVPRFVDVMPKSRGSAFHVYRLHSVRNPEELVVAMVCSNVVRNRLRKAFRNTGASYDVHMGTHYERNFLYSDYFWRWNRLETGLNFTEMPSREEYLIALRQSLFYTRIGHEDRSFALNVILGISPELELAAYELMTYEKLMRTLGENPPAHWWCVSE